MVGSTLGVYSFGLIFVSARANKRHHHLQQAATARPEKIQLSIVVVIPVSDVHELLLLKTELSEEVAKVWLMTAKKGFSLTDEDQMVVCPKDLREGTITDRYLAPAITRFC
jgi:hypothetical protein